MARGSSTPAGVRLETESDAIAEEVSRRCASWIQQMRRTDPGPHRLEAILVGLSFTILDHLPEDTIPEAWADLLARYMEANTDEEDPGNPAEQAAAEDPPAAVIKDQEEPPAGGVLDQAAEADAIHHQAGHFPKPGGRGSQSGKAPRASGRRGKPDPA